MTGDLAFLGIGVVVLIGLLRITEWSVGWDSWPAFVALPVALLLVGAWHKARS